MYCDGSEYNAHDYPLLFEVITDDYGGNGGTFSKENFGTTPGTTFKVPDYKTKKLVGAGGGVSGAGSPVSGNVISVVGATGGRWYFSKDEQENLFDIGNIIISGYTNVTEFVGGSLSGEVTIQVGPLQEKMISAVPEHEHAILTSSAPQAGAFEGGGGPVDDHAVGFKDSNGQVNSSYHLVEFHYSTHMVLLIMLYKTLTFLHSETLVVLVRSSLLLLHKQILVLVVFLMYHRMI